MLKEYIQKSIYKRLTGESRVVLENKVPSAEDLYYKFQNIDELGIYLHIPFCRQICPYCPYNKERYHPELASEYTVSLIKEIEYYAGIIGDRPVTTFYIGGGTPTTMLRNGIETIIDHVYKLFNMQCQVHMESHPNDLTEENLKFLKSMGVKYLSIGVEALQDRHLETLKRTYTTREVKLAVERATRMGFECVNVDFIFALQNQTYREIEEAGEALVNMGIQQAAAYPLFQFPYTKFGQNGSSKSPGLLTLFKRRKMLRILENIFYDSGFERSSVWAFTKKGIDKYCSVTVPLYLGLGVSGGSYLKDIFFINTFKVGEYIKSINENKIPTALSMDLTDNMQMAGWLYWRIYETRFMKEDFNKRFGIEFSEVYGKYMRFLSHIGFLKDFGQEIRLTDKGAYWLHAFEDYYSIDYISKLWGISNDDPWPEKVVLMDGKNVSDQIDNISKEFSSEIA
jgi:coproporphyrinogen III oxidase-like Fe-S oxidoreductase